MSKILAEVVSENEIQGVLSAVDGFVAWLDSDSGKSIDDNGVDEPRALEIALGVGDSELSARVAPSIVARADCQILGISYPRLAIRLYLNKDLTSFVNLRKHKCLLSGTASYKPQRHPKPSQQDQNFELVPDSTFLRSVVRKSPIFADWVLQIPSRLAEFNVLKTELGLAYGENRKFEASPYVQPLHCSGACVQSVLQLVSILLQKYASSVCGIAEISAICSDWTVRSEHRIDYISDNQISIYSRKSGLFSFKQIPDFIANQGTDPIALFHHAIASYVNSGFPVGVPVDLGRLLGFNRRIRTSTMDRICPISPPSDVFNFYSDREKAGVIRRSQPDQNNHQVLVVGCKEGRVSKDGNELIIHDPASRPFLKVRSGDLYLAGTYSKENPLAIHSGVFTAFTPSCVRMSLYKYSHVVRIGDGTRFASALVPGVAELSNSLFLRQRELIGRTSSYDLDSLPSVNLTDDPLPEYRLIQVKDVVTKLKSIQMYSGDPQIYRELENYFLGGSERPGDGFECVVGKEHWVWIQVFTTSVWIWNAQSLLTELKPSDPVKWGEHLIYSGGMTDVADEFTNVCAGSLGETFSDYREVSSTWHRRQWDEEGARRFDEVEVGIITSARGGGLLAALDWIPESCRFIDFYAFMQADIEGELFEDIISSQDSDEKIHSLRASAAISDDGNAIDELSSRINRSISQSGKDLQIRAVSTFLPEVLSFSEEEFHLAKKALIGIYKLALKLNDVGHNIETIELVSGSKNNGIWQGKRRVFPYDYATLTNGGILVDQREQFRQILSDVIEKVGGGVSPIPFSVELEPGPLSLISDLASMNSFISSIEGDQKLSSSAGVNFDLSHWILARITPQDIDQRLLSRIAGIHINDHSKGHFGDVCFGTFGGGAGWEGVFRTLFNNRQDSGFSEFQCSPYVSAEIEAAKSKREVEETYNNIVEYFRKL